MAKRVVSKPMQGRKSWSLALWARFLLAAKSPVEVRRRLELARSDARAEWLAELETIAQRRAVDLEAAPPVNVVAAPDAIELPAPDEHSAIVSDGAERDFGSWWWS